MDTQLVMRKKVINIEPEKSLICAIIAQATHDYRTLRTENVNKKRDSSSSYSVSEIERFFNGNWCLELIGFLDISLSGKDIIHKLKTEDLSKVWRGLNCQKYL